MADGTRIEWADATLNYVNGCSVISPGCTNCYAMRLAGTRLKHHPSRYGLTLATKAGPVWTGEVRAHEAALMQALKLKRGRRIFWNAHGDLFHENVPDKLIDRQFAVMALTPPHTHMVLTKRSARMRHYFADEDAIMRIGAVQREIDPGATCCECVDRDAIWPLSNVWLGVSVEDQARADERIPDLLATPAAVRFLSCEPLLGQVDLTSIPTFRYQGAEYLNALTGGLRGMFGEGAGRLKSRIDWIIAGGESGPSTGSGGSRPMHPDWARSLRDQCAAASVPFFFKQWGEWLPAEKLDWKSPGVAKEMIGGIYLGNDYYAGKRLHHFEDNQPMLRVGKKRAGRLLDGVEHSSFPERAR